MDKAFAHFKKVDSALYEIALQVELKELVKPEDPFVDLVESIINQQLSDKAAASIFGRFKKLFPREQISPEKLLKLSDQKIRKAGISFSKIKYIKGIAKEIKDNKLNLISLEGLADEEVINELTKLKGVGQWTAEMFLMFTLGRKDVFSTGDLGLQNAMIKLYKLKNKPNREKILEISSKWSPYRTIASRILWKSLELK
ncbi:MAG: DNA-3-methyladenine glycosylase 2 family protein [Candidatus Levybacteria bacterium]|nr:DNA-3-methyladenine glycosylase 2 family protein [Candidatus Levybacteria bacterium]